MRDLIRALFEPVLTIFKPTIISSLNVYILFFLRVYHNLIIFGSNSDSNMDLKADFEGKCKFVGLQSNVEKLAFIGPQTKKAVSDSNRGRK